MYPEDQQAKNYPDEEIDNYRKLHKDELEPEHHKHAKIVLIFVFLLLLAIVVGLSYFLSNNDESLIIETPVIVNEKLNSESENENQKVSLSNDWFLYKSTEYDIKIPDGWSMVHQDNGVLLMSCDANNNCYDLEEGVEGTVEEVVGGRDGLQGFLYALQTEATVEDLTSGYLQIKEVADGYMLYSKESTDTSGEDVLGESLPAGTVEYIALKQVSDGKISYFYYSVTPGQTNPAILVEEMITSLTIN